MAGAGFMKLMKDLNANNRNLQDSIGKFKNKGDKAIYTNAIATKLTFKKATAEEIIAFKTKFQKIKRREKVVDAIILAFSTFVGIAMLYFIFA